MRVLERQLCFFFFLLSPFNFLAQSVLEVEDEVWSSQFPNGFLFGTATSSYQVEGAYLEDGKGVNNWDVFSHIPGKTRNNENGDIADDHYHRYLEDIELMHSLGVNAYRFSISWARILPKGIFGEVNTNGIMFYNKIIDNLLRNGIQPFVTINHHDMPQELEDRYGGWLSSLIQRDFVYFSEICFKNFGDRVKYWTTINQPNIAADLAYLRGKFPPGRCSQPFGNCYAGNSDVEPLIASHNMILTHAMTVGLYRKNFQEKKNGSCEKQGGTIGIVTDAIMYEPLRDEECDRDAVNRAFAFYLGRLLDPLVFGDYPTEMRLILGCQLPRFSPEETKLIKGSLDFIGINHYTTLYVKDCISSPCSLGGDHPIQGFLETIGTRDGIPIGDQVYFDMEFLDEQGTRKAVISYDLKLSIQTVKGEEAPWSLHPSQCLYYTG